MKRISLFILFLGCLDILLLSCCKDSILDYTKIDAISVTNSRLRDDQQDSAILEESNFRIKLEITGDFIAKSTPPFTFSSAAYATSCKNMGQLGLKNDIVKFEITCSGNILNTPAGTPIDVNQVRAYDYIYFDDVKNTRQTIAEWLQILNNGGRHQASYQLYFEFMDPIISTEFLTFNLRIEQADGTVFTATTKHVKLV